MKKFVLLLIVIVLAFAGFSTPNKQTPINSLSNVSFTYPNCSQDVSTVDSVLTDLPN
jgi:hypothetical protein